MRENVRRVNASVIPVHGSACPVERQQSCQEGERGRRELEKGLGKKYDLGRFLGPPKFKKPNTKPSHPAFAYRDAGRGDRDRWAGHWCPVTAASDFIRDAICTAWPR